MISRHACLVPRWRVFRLIFACLGPPFPSSHPSKRLLDYACFHKSDLEEAYRDNDHSNHNGMFHMEGLGDLGGPLGFFYKVFFSAV